MPIQKITSGIIESGQTLTTPTISGNLSLDSTGTTGVRVPSANTLVAYAAGVERVRITSDGNLGIGTTTPTGPLHAVQNQSADITTTFEAATAGYASNLLLQGNNAAGSRYNNIASRYGSTYQWQIGGGGVDSTIMFKYGSSLTEAMRINSSGNVLLGKTASSGLTQGIELQNDGIALFTTATNASDPLVYFVNSNASPTNGFRYVSFRAGSGFSQVGTITTNGSSTTAYNTSSDYRLKEDIAPMTGALNTVSALKPVTYKWKSDGSAGQGFIAHELQAIVPDCVTGTKDGLDKDGNPEYQGVDVSFLVATLTAAIQEQQTIINDLKSRIEALEAK